jgi:hypothetical protein
MPNSGAEWVQVAALLSAGVLLGAASLRAGAWLYNAIAVSLESLNRTPMPPWRKSLAISLAVFAVYFGVVPIVYLAGGSDELLLIALFLSFPAPVIVMWFLVTSWLPSTFTQGLVLTVCFVVFVILAFVLYNVALAAIIYSGVLGARANAVRPLLP